ncbi:probable GPI-anchored adhesin-like protein PGA18 [Ixodes scapularis]|uniref:probable GPI-anchored adhesin-like protein PGA18 n=1 Tax=Ixodes scapularis TaxID=6945 RepID=UPI001A9E941D|nr:probable GPI-anchored adhesin-like protein PGA18 [Ixodes scapularis]
MFGYGGYCCVAWCRNNGRTRKKPGTKFFRIPRDDRSKAWLQYANRDDLLGKQATELFMKYRICSDHFLARDFMDSAKTRLTRTAVPSVHSEAQKPVSNRQTFPGHKEATTFGGTPSTSCPLASSMGAHDHMEATTPGSTPSTSCPLASSMVAHDHMEATTPGSTPSTSCPLASSMGAHVHMEATTPGSTPSTSCPLASSMGAHDPMKATTPSNTPSTSCPLASSTGAHGMRDLHFETSSI